MAESHGAVIGNVLIMEDGWGPFFFRLAVAKDYRDKGVRSRLLKEVECVLAEKGYQEVYCLVTDDDTELKTYYKKRGFEEGDKSYHQRDRPRDQLRPSPHRIFGVRIDS